LQQQAAWALFSLTMESLFSPCTRLRDIIRPEFLISLEELQEQNLDVPTEELLSAERAFTYADLYAMLGNQNEVLWLTPHAAVVPEGGKGLEYCLRSGDQPWRFTFSADGKDIVAMASSFEHSLEISDVVIRLLAASVVDSAHIKQWASRFGLLINAPSLEYLMEKCQNLQVLTLNRIQMDANHYLVLGDYSRPDLEIVLDNCRLTSAGTSALAEVLGRNQGPNKLVGCHLDNSVIANGLRGNSRLKNFEPLITMNVEVGNQEVLAIADALKENKGLVDFDLRSYFMMSNESWDAICDSLKTHPTLQNLSLWPLGAPPPSAIKCRIQAVADMLKVNLSIHTISLHDHYLDHELFQESAVPYLETNRLRPCLLAIQKTCPLSVRAKVLGRALLATRTNANSLWMLLSGNAEVAFPSTTVTATRAPSTTGASAPANVASTPTACQKRKAHS
jgi:hypothetical protein